ncbi:MAG: NYN domain-containing protein [Treponema sp.]|nr:NYN domain-containing protein [Treponema sp.]
MSDAKIKANVYIDGNFTFHIHKYLTEAFGKTIDWKAFLEYVKDRICKEEDTKKCVLQSQFFVGTSVNTTDSEREFLYTSMEHANIIKHATPLKQKDTGGLKEDAVDTNLVFYATKDYFKEEYDYLVLLAGDSDFVPLVTGLKEETVKTFVFYMDFQNNGGKTQTSQMLLESSDMQQNFEALRLERVDPKIKSIFVDHGPKTVKEEPAKVSTDKKVIVIKKKLDVEAAPEGIPFTKEQLEKAIKLTQQQRTGGANDFVLIAQAGENLSKLTGERLHGKLITMIETAYPNDFVLNLEKSDAPSIKLLFK